MKFEVFGNLIVQVNRKLKFKKPTLRSDSKTNLRVIIFIVLTWWIEWDREAWMKWTCSVEIIDMNQVLVVST